MKPKIPPSHRRRPSNQHFDVAQAKASPGQSSGASPLSMKGGNASPFAAALRAKAAKMNVEADPPAVPESTSKNAPPGILGPTGSAANKANVPPGIVAPRAFRSPHLVSRLLRTMCQPRLR